MGIARRLLPVSLTVCMTVFGGCVGARRTGAPLPAVAPETLVTAAGTAVVGDAWTRGAEYVLLGEEHPNACDHLAQAAAIRRLVTAGVRPVIGLEMVSADRQDILDAFNRGELAVEDLPRALDWAHTWGYPFALYAPVFTAAREAHLPVFALNAPVGLVRKVGRVGLSGLTPAERASLPGKILPPGPAQTKMLREFFDQHQAMLRTLAKKPKSAMAGPLSGRDLFASFVTVQSLWDTQMAFRASLARALYGRPVAIVAGSGHVESGWGIARRLRVFDPGATIVSVMPWRGGEAAEPGDADLFYFCPESHRSRLGMTFTQAATPPAGRPEPPLVSEVAPGSPAALAGLLPGDAVTAAGDRPVTGLTDLHRAGFAALRAGKPLVLTVHRGGESLTVSIPLPKLSR